MKVAIVILCEVMDQEAADELHEDVSSHVEQMDGQHTIVTLTGEDAAKVRAMCGE